MVQQKRKSGTSSVIALIAVNLFPVYGVLMMGWEVFPVMLLFWSENIIIGFFNVLRMLTCYPGKRDAWLAKIFMILFFIVHYGIFTSGHGIFIFAIFGQRLPESGRDPGLMNLWQIIAEYKLVYAMIALFASHGYSFVSNYLVRGEYKSATLQELMSRPYGRVILLHVTIIFGGMLMMLLKSPLSGLLLFIGLKIVMDLRAHLREHRDTGTGIRQRRKTAGISP